MKTKQLHWNVFAEDFNNRKIVPYDIFDHGSFAVSFKKLRAARRKGLLTDTEFLEKVRSELVYFFWAKCEHEIYLDGLFDRDGSERLKVDIYAQISLNWDRFAEYLLANA